MEAFLRVNEMQIEHILSNLKQFKTAVSEQSSIERLINKLRNANDANQENNYHRKKLNNNKNDSSKFKTKPASMSGVNRVTVIGVFIGLVLCLLNLLPFILIMAFSQEFTTAVNEDILKVTKVNDIVMESGLALN